MQKIGILTFHNPINYGAALQAYALESYIISQEYDAKIIDYRNLYISSDTKALRIFRTKGLFRKVYSFFEFPFWLIRKKKFHKFVYSIPVGKRTDMRNIETEFGKIIVGSDQVWNLEMTHQDFRYFLEGINNVEKASYASSFGNRNLDDAQKERIKNSLETFRYLSVRENSGKEIVDNLLGKGSCKVVLDPTFLLEASMWSSLADTRQCRKKYIVIYQLSYAPELIKIAKELQTETGYPIVTINGNPRQPLKAKYVLTAGPREWLAWIRDAEYVITNSFHGTVFSIIFEKQFSTVLLTEQKSRNDRVITLLKQLGLENQIGAAGKTLIDKSVDYKKTKTRLEHLITCSKNYLQIVLEQTDEKI